MRWSGGTVELPTKCRAELAAQHQGESRRQHQQSNQNPQPVPVAEEHAGRDSVRVIGAVEDAVRHGDGKQAVLAASKDEAQQGPDQRAEQDEQAEAGERGCDCEITEKGQRPVNETEGYGGQESCDEDVMTG